MSDTVHVPEGQWRKEKRRKKFNNKRKDKKFRDKKIKRIDKKRKNNPNRFEDWED